MVGASIFTASIGLAAAIMPIPAGADSGDVGRPIVVSVAANGRVLWRGALLVTQGVPARYAEQRSEPAESRCADGADWPSPATSLDFSIARTNAADGYSVSLEWRRPVASATCDEDDERAISLTEIIVLPSGGRVTVAGDAGLAIELSRS